MTHERRRPDSDGPVRRDTAFAPDALRAETAWLLARDADATAPAPAPKIAHDYQLIEGMLSDAPSLDDDAWQDQVLEAAAVAAIPPRPWWRDRAVRWATSAAAAAIGVAVVVVMWRSPAQLEVAIHHANASRGGPAEAVVGDRLAVAAHTPGPSELRVYRSDGVLVASCPGGPHCVAVRTGDHALEVTLDVPAQYQVILVVGGGALHGATQDDYLAAAHAAHAEIVSYPAIDVR